MVSFRAFCIRSSAILLISFGLSHPALAHHAMGGEQPNTVLTGFLSGLAHPIIGLDHLVFILVMGLIASTQSQGLWLVISFTLAAWAGTGLHLAAVDLPLVELLIALSVVGAGLYLSLQRTWPLILSMSLAVGAGVLHGYAYGESIVGAEVSPLLAYLMGLSCIQLGLMASVYRVSQLLLKSRVAFQPQWIGYITCVIGATFLAITVVGS